MRISAYYTQELGTYVGYFEYTVDLEDPCTDTTITIDSAILPSLSLDYTLWGYSDDTFALDSSYVTSTAEAN